MHRAGQIRASARRLVDDDKTVLFASSRADVTDTILDMRTFEPEAVAIDPGRQQWTALKSAVAPELALIQARLPDHGFQVQSQTDDDRC